MLLMILKGEVKLDYQMGEYKVFKGRECQGTIIARNFLDAVWKASRTLEANIVLENEDRVRYPVCQIRTKRLQ